MGLIYHHHLSKIMKPSVKLLLEFYSLNIVRVKYSYPQIVDKI